MPTVRTPSSDSHIGLGPLLVLEGMPGTGKTTAVTRLASQGRQVIGEYTTTVGVTIPVGDHPPVADDSAHQANWLTKHRHVLAARRTGPVFCDRDWISALAYAASLPDGNRLLLARAGWAVRHLHRGDLAVADAYLVLHVDAATSLTRRGDRLTPGHPWSTPAGLARAAAFYTDPAAALAPVNPDLASALRSAAWRHLTGASLDHTLRCLHDLAGRP